MSEFTLAQLFGVGAFQDEFSLTINKSDFFSLTPAANNSAEQLFVALIKKAWKAYSGYVQTETGLPITDENDQPVTFDNSVLYWQMVIFYWKKNYLKRDNQMYQRVLLVFQFNIDSTLISETINPNDLR